jgi:hypothetical protein
MDNVAAKSNDAAWRIIRKKSSGSELLVVVLQGLLLLFMLPEQISHH